MRPDRFLLLIAGTALAAILGFSLPMLAHGTVTDWDSLGPASQSLLAPWHERWNGLPGSDRERLLANAARWQAMNGADRDALLKRQMQWQALAPLERARLRSRYAAWLQLPSAEQTRVRAAATRFGALSTTQQGVLRANFDAQSLDSQLSWLAGPTTGAWLDQAGTWFAFVPANERDATLRMLQDLAPEARAQLFELSRRLASPRREQLRQDLLLTPPSQRAALIAQRLAQ